MSEETRCLLFFPRGLPKARSTGFFSEEEMKERDPQPDTQRQEDFELFIFFMFSSRTFGRRVLGTFID